MTARGRWEFKVLLGMYVMYGAMMLCRNTIVVASPALILDPALDMDKAQYGRIMAYASAGAFVGKLTLGAVADRLGGRRTLLLTLAAVIGLTWAFGLVASILFLIVFNTVAHWVKTAGWPGMCHIVGQWYSTSKHGRIWGIISTCSRLGVMTSTLLLGYLLTVASWRTLFFVAGGLATATLIAGWFLIPRSPQSVGLSPPSEEDLARPESSDPVERSRHPLADATLLEALKDFATSQRVWFCALSIGTVTLLMDFINFVPIYLAETLNLSPGMAGMAGTALPFGCLVAGLGGGFLYDSLTRRQHVALFGGLQLVAAGCVLALYWLPSAGLSPRAGMIASMITIFFFGASVAPFYYIPPSVFSIDYGGRHVGVLMGLIDACGYIGAMLFNYFGGSIAQEYGWGVFLQIVFVCILLGALLITRFTYLETKAHSGAEKVSR